MEGLHEGPYLSGLRQLKHSTCSSIAQPWYLPACLVTATSLELLDLSRDGALRLRGAEDAALLRTLPRLRHVLLPWRERYHDNAAAIADCVNCIREGLRAGAGAGVGPSHAVKVEGGVR